jgi:hypothetical protein
VLLGWPVGVGGLRHSAVLVSLPFSALLRLFTVIAPMRRLLAWRFDAAVMLGVVSLPLRV